MACHRIPKQAAMDLKPSDLTRTVSDMALITKAVDKPLSQYMTAGYLKLKPGYDRELSTEYEEVNLFLEGSLTYSFEGERFTAQKGGCGADRTGQPGPLYHGRRLSGFLCPLSAAETPPGLDRLFGMAGQKIYLISRFGG